jgi:hypothetical protein
MRTLLPLALLLTGCGWLKPDDTSAPDDTQPEGDADTDADADGDSDADGDADADADTDIPCTGTGFEGNASYWSLPATRVDNTWPWDGTAGTDPYSDCLDSPGTNGEVAWTTMDLTGDGVYDLVITKDRCGPSGLGSTFWEVYPGEGSDFVSSAIYWSLPASRVDNTWPWDGIAGTDPYSDCLDSPGTNGQVAWTTTDLTGDGAVDLVVTKDVCGPSGLGSTFWEVYAGEGSGFASSATYWSLPATRVDDTWPWDGLAGTDPYSDCLDAPGTNGQVAWTTTDLSGDGAPDLVVTKDVCGPSGLGSTFWEVYEGSGAGFSSSATYWSLPATRVDNTWPWDGTAGTDPYSDCLDAPGTNGQVAWTTTDLDGDGAPDLVVTKDVCGPSGLGSTFWELYTGQGSGFASSASYWSLPATRVETTWPWDGLTGTDPYSDCLEAPGTNGQVAWTTVDLTTDGVPDLIITKDVCGPSGLGASFWELYAGGASGFDNAASYWSLPAARIDIDEPWDGLSGSDAYSDCLDAPGTNGELAWTTFDLSGSGVVDLVVTKDRCGPSGLGSTFWEIYPGVCVE